MLFTKERVKQAHARLDTINLHHYDHNHPCAKWYQEDVPDLIKHIRYLEQQFEAVVKKLHSKDGKNG